jgi:hypothetical protein
MEDTFEYLLTVKVKVTAFDQTDAEDAIKDVFGTGDDCGVTVTDLDIKKV